jgi:hypothetical protein
MAEKTAAEKVAAEELRVRNTADIEVIFRDENGNQVTSWRRKIGTMAAADFVATIDDLFAVDREPKL